MKLHKIVIFIVFILVSFSFTSKSHGSYFIYTANVKDNKVNKSEEFYCTESIYIFVESSDSSLGATTAKIEWINPYDTLTRSVESRFKMIDSSNYYLWDGIKFTPKNEPLSNFTMFILGPSESLSDVIGTWQVIVHLANDQSHKKTFTVNC